VSTFAPKGQRGPEADPIDSNSARINSDIEVTCPGGPAVGEEEVDAEGKEEDLRLPITNPQMTKGKDEDFHMFFVPHSVIVSQEGNHEFS
jgi:hypothetical protein